MTADVSFTLTGSAAEGRFLCRDGAANFVPLTSVAAEEGRTTDDLAEYKYWLSSYHILPCKIQFRRRIGAGILWPIVLAGVAELQICYLTHCTLLRVVYLFTSSDAWLLGKALVPVTRGSSGALFILTVPRRAQHCGRADLLRGN